MCLRVPLSSFLGVHWSVFGVHILEGLLECVGAHEGSVERVWVPLSTFLRGGSIVHILKGGGVPLSNS